MKKLIITTILLATTSLANAGDYAACLLDSLPGLENDHAASAAVSVCKAAYPGGLESVPAGSGRGVLSFKSGAECALNKSGQTRSLDAAYLIRAACNRLYDEPNFFDQFDGS